VDAILWIVLGVVLAIAEAFTASFLIIFFAVGALAAGGAAALGAGPLLQAIVFALVSGLSVAALRPIVVRHVKLSGETDDHMFGLEALQGGHGLVLEEINTDRGMIRIDGELWQARAYDGNEIYLPGERVRVIKVIGATAIVWREDMPGI
jgi:membrane protein implicated in regulation of membrane protease activity